MEGFSQSRVSCHRILSCSQKFSERNEYLCQAALGLETTKQRNTFMYQCECVRHVACIIGSQRECIQRKADRPLDAQLTHDCQAWLGILTHSSGIALVARYIGK